MSMDALPCGGMCSGYTTAELCSGCRRWFTMTPDERTEETRLIAQHVEMTDQEEVMPNVE